MDISELLNKKESLHPDLVEHYTVGSPFPMIRHPMLYSIPHSENLNALVNYQYLEKLRMLEVALNEENYERAVFLYERAYRVNAFWMHAADNLDDSNYWELLSSVYIDSENIYQNFDLWESLLTANRDYREKFMREEDLIAFNALPSKLIIYRGIRHRDHLNGFSWTLDKDMAVWFANRYHVSTNNDTPIIVSGEVNKSDCIGYLNGRNESEIVCHWNSVSILD